MSIKDTMHYQECAKDRSMTQLQKLRDAAEALEADLRDFADSPFKQEGTKSLIRYARNNVDAARFALNQAIRDENGEIRDEVLVWGRGDNRCKQKR